MLFTAGTYGAKFPTAKKKAATIAAISFTSKRGAASWARDLFAVVLVFVDLVAHVIRFLVELSLVFLGQVAIIGSHVFLFIVLQTLFASLQIGGLPRRQLIVFDAIGNAILLILFALVHLIDARMAGIVYAGAGAGSVAGLGLSSSGSDSQQTAHCQD
jgi:hypothetical protein